jgi:hypothetical protein
MFLENFRHPSQGETMTIKMTKTLTLIAGAALLFGCSESKSVDPKEDPKSSSVTTTSSSSVATTETAFCDDKGDKPEDSIIPEGDIEADICLGKHKTWALGGYVYVRDGATISIEPGTTIASTDGALFIDRGAKIMAAGLVDAPIVFTSALSTPAPGDWGGIIIYGKAPVSTADKTLENEAIAGDIFGGTMPTDNSGILRYVRIEYAGEEVALDQELNGLTLGGVGSGTALEYVQVDRGSDDNFEWFGGNASGSYLVSSNGQDDGFDIDYGFQGTISHSLNIGRDESFDGVGSDFGIESGSKALDASRITDVHFDHITVVITGLNSKQSSAGVHMKDNVKLSITNSVFLATSEINSVIITEGATTIANVDAADYSNNYYAGLYTTPFNSADAAVVTAIESGFTFVNGAILGNDFAVIASAVADDEIGAFTEGAWHVGWTKPGSLEVEGIEISAAPEFCDDKGDVPAGTTIPAGDVDADICLSNDKTWSLGGYVYVRDGATISIEPGTVIASTDGALFIDRGAKIMADGSADDPIVFTSALSTPAPGDWGGIIIYGKAPVSTADKTLENEAIAGDIFGGNLPADNSGILRYVRIEYAGEEVALDQELNGLTLGGVGSGTTLEYVQVDRGSDDNFEWFGGNASGSYLISSNGQDDGFDIDYGFQGTISHSLNIGRDESFDGVGSDFGIESGSKALDAARITDVHFDYVTIVITGLNSKQSSAGVHMKDNVKLSITNSVFVATSEINSVIITEGATTIANVDAADYSNNFYAGDYTTPFNSADADVVTAIEGGFTAVTGSILSDDLSVISAAVGGEDVGAFTTGDWASAWAKPNSLDVSGL